MGCTISRTREIGLAEGESLLAQDNRLKMSYLPRETLAAANDLVVTTGLGGVFPSGLIVGTVEDVIPESSGKSMYAVVRPAADVRDITSVFIITNYDSDTAQKAAAPAHGTPETAADAADPQEAAASAPAESAADTGTPADSNG